MNIDQLPAEAKIKEVYVPKFCDWEEMIAMRRSTFFGFLQVEKQKGVIDPKIPFSSSKGQETLRILCFRVLEEAAESFVSENDSHVKEEAIDAFNYLISIPLLDHTGPSDEQLANHLSSLSYQVYRDHEEPLGLNLTLEDLGNFTVLLGGDLGDVLRNRAWMEQTQDPYFSGSAILLRVILKIGERLMRVFDSYHEFSWYFRAKDYVLQFRLKTKY